MSKIIRNSLTIPWRGKSRVEVEALIKRYLREDEEVINALSEQVEALISYGPWNSGAIWDNTRVWNGV